MLQPLHIVNPIQCQESEPRIDLEKMMQLKSTHGMSNNQFKKVSTVLRDSGVRCPSIGNFYEKKELSLDLMQCTQISLDHSKDRYNSDIKETFVVLCMDICTLIDRFYGKTNTDLHRLKFIVGLDYGREYLKLVLSLRGENSVSSLVYLWVSKVPEKNFNFRKFFYEEQICKPFDNL